MLIACPTASRDGLYSAAQTDYTHWDIVIDLCAVTQLAIPIPSPAFDAVCHGQGTGVIPAGRDGLDTAAQTHHIHRDIAICLCAVTQLAMVVVSPAFDAPRRGQGAGVPPAGRDGLDTAGQTRHIHRDIAIYLCVVAQLAIRSCIPNI